MIHIFSRVQKLERIHMFFSGEFNLSGHLGKDGSCRRKDCHQTAKQRNTYSPHIRLSIISIEAKRKPKKLVSKLPERLAA